MQVGGKNRLSDGKVLAWRLIAWQPKKLGFNAAGDGRVRSKHESSQNCERRG
jgi:hypothetical protein